MVELNQLYLPMELCGVSWRYKGVCHHLIIHASKLIEGLSRWYSTLKYFSQDEEHHSYFHDLGDNGTMCYNKHTEINAYTTLASS